MAVPTGGADAIQAMIPSQTPMPIMRQGMMTWTRYSRTMTCATTFTDGIVLSATGSCMRI